MQNMGRHVAEIRHALVLNSERQDVRGPASLTARHFPLLMKTEAQLLPEGRGSEQMCSKRK